MEKYILSDGTEFPKIGFGTYKSEDGEISHVIDTAIKAGYRYFDTAKFYYNEDKVGSAVKSSGMAREDFIIATKVWKDELGYQKTKNSIERSLELLDTDYIDLFLIHWPKASPSDTDWKANIAGSWRAMEEAAGAGKIKVLGVSNFLAEHLKVIFSVAKIKPAVNQLEFHPGYTQDDAVEFSKKNGILVQAWSPLGRRRVLEDETIRKIAENTGKTAAQICLRYAIQRGVMPLPKASSLERMNENKDIFDFSISGEDMETISRMPITGWSGEHPDHERTVIA